jgi:hypothetical protein
MGNGRKKRAEQGCKDGHKVRRLSAQVEHLQKEVVQMEGVTQ